MRVTKNWSQEAVKLSFDCPEASNKGKVEDLMLEERPQPQIFQVENMFMFMFMYIYSIGPCLAIIREQ